MLRFNAWDLSRSWASVALAQGNDDARPVLYRTTLIEIFDEGIRLVSTDTYVLLKSWIANTDHPDAAEPLMEEVPRDVAICRDLDHRVLALMKYVQKITKEDGTDTPVTMEFAVGESSDAGNTLEGMAASTVHLRIVQNYDESIETPVFEGTFPNWRPLWAAHEWAPASTLGFGADGILRLGALSKLWDKSVIRFELGGNVGVARIIVEGPSYVNVTGLVMPTGMRGGESAEVKAEGATREFAEAFDDWYAELLKTEDAGDEDASAVVSAAFDDQVDQAVRFVNEAGYFTLESLAANLGTTTNAAEAIAELLCDEGAVDPPDEHGRYTVKAVE